MADAATASLAPHGHPHTLARSPPRTSAGCSTCHLFAEDTEGVRAALIDLGAPGGLLDARDPLDAGPQELITNLDFSANNPNNPSQAAGLTFLGQFVDHDVTFDASSRLGTPTVPADTRNFRSPALDLDSVYGDGPVADQRLYDPADGIKFRLESEACSRISRGPRHWRQSSPIRATTRT